MAFVPRDIESIRRAPTALRIADRELFDQLAELDPRLHERITMTEHPGMVTPCWRVTGYAANARGYVNFARLEPRQESRALRKVYAHRWTVDLLLGPWFWDVSGFTYDWTAEHRCAVKVCCSPMHIAPMSIGENLKQPTCTNTKHAAHVRGACDFGHPLSGENARPAGNGTVQCCTCGSVYRRAYNRIRRAAVRAGEWDAAAKAQAREAGRAAKEAQPVPGVGRIDHADPKTRLRPPVPHAAPPEAHWGSRGEPPSGGQ